MHDWFADKLINWYDKNMRNLPWRGTTDPYKIWLSEIILQQTRVDQGLNYYHAFVQHYPDVFSLAEATSDEVYKLWQGLGYYNRADNLMHTAKTIVVKYNGIFPEDPKELMKLRGIGSYTSAAIASLAFDVSVPVIDGNVYRLLSRIFDIKTPIDSMKGKKEFEELAGNLMPGQPAATYNQAIMEFGALYCKPSKPDCTNCIFIDNCFAGRSNTVNDYPVKKPKVKVKNRYFFYLLVESNKSSKSGFLMKRRGKKDIWKNLYDMPLIEQDYAIDPAEIMSNEYFKELIGDNTYQIIDISDSYVHKLTHQHIHTCFIRLIVDNLSIGPDEKSLFLVNQSELKNYPVSRLIERYLQVQQLIK